MLYHLASNLHPVAMLLGVGSYSGASACFLADAALEIGSGAKMHRVDTRKNEGMTEGQRDTWVKFRTNTTPFAQIIVPHHIRLEEVATVFAAPLVLLFINGKHCNEGCRNVLAWLAKLNPGGLIIMRDYAWAEGVKRAVAELIRPRRTDRDHVMANIYWTSI